MQMQMQMQMKMKMKLEEQTKITKNNSKALWLTTNSLSSSSSAAAVAHSWRSSSIRAVSRNSNGSDASKKASGGVGGGGGGGGGGSVPNSNYVVPLDKTFSSSLTSRPLAEILRDLNKRIPDNIVVKTSSSQSPSPNYFIPWYHANRMLSFYAPGWCGEIRDVIYSENATVTVVYRLTIRGSDGEAYRESSGTISSSDGDIADPVAAAEEIAFCRACARFGLGLYLYHEE